MALIKCPSGWIVVPSETGEEYVPFFVHVRNEDIHWKESKKLKETIEKAMGSIGDGSIQKIEPGYTYRVMNDGWSMDIQSDGFVTATKQISIDDLFQFEDDSHMVLNRNIDLPLFIKKDSFFNIQSTISPNDEDMKYASSNVLGIESSIDDGDHEINGYNTIKLSLNSYIYRFSEMFTNDYKNSIVFISVRGFTPIFDINE